MSQSNAVENPYQEFIDRHRDLLIEYAKKQWKYGDDEYEKLRENLVEAFQMYEDEKKLEPDMDMEALDYFDQ